MMKLKHLTLITFALYLFFYAGARSSLAQNTKPNIVIFISDDQNQMDMGCYGNGDVHTPHMDQLASEGMRFTSAFAASPMCAPSRSNMFTGLYPFRNGSQVNHFSLKPGIKTLPDYLKNLGYRVVIAGKIDVYPKPNFEHIGEYFGKYEPAKNRNDPRKVTVNFINDNFSGQSDKPICLIVSVWLPHVPWTVNRDFDPDKLKVPEDLVDTKETRKALASYYQSIKTADDLLGEVMTAVNNTGQEDNTVFMYFSDQGAQFPGAKWTTYDRGLRIPFMVKWPKKIKKGAVSDALISLTDLTPTLINLAGGKAIDGLDGKSFVDVLLGKKKTHREYIYAETSVEPQYWYNYVPARSIFTQEGYHYIKNYNPGVRFITHIDKVERNMFYFDSWIEKAKNDKNARFLLNRYSYRPPEELYYTREDQWEFNNLVEEDKHAKTLSKLQGLLSHELSEQGETKAMILQGQLPTFYSHSYGIMQGISVHQLSFDRSLWNPDTLFITGFIDGLHQDGILCQYFSQFQLFIKGRKIGLAFGKDEIYYSKPVSENKGQIIFKLSADGNYDLKLEGVTVLKGKVQDDFTKINGGYVSCGFIRDGDPPADLPIYFKGNIHNLRFSMNMLNRAPNNH